MRQAIVYPYICIQTAFINSGVSDNKTTEAVERLRVIPGNNVRRAKRKGMAESGTALPKDSLLEEP